MTCVSLNLPIFIHFLGIYTRCSSQQCTLAYWSQDWQLQSSLTRSIIWFRLYCTTLHEYCTNTELYCTILNHTAQCWTKLNPTASLCTILCQAAPCSTIWMQHQLHAVLITRPATSAIISTRFLVDSERTGFFPVRNKLEFSFLKLYKIWIVQIADCRLKIAPRLIE